MGMTSIVGGPFKADTNQCAIAAYVVRREVDTDGSTVEVDFPSDMAIRASKEDEQPKHVSFLLLVGECEDCTDTRSSSHMATADSRKQLTSMFTIVRRNSESMQAGQFWRLSPVSPTRYTFEPIEPRDFMNDDEIFLSDRGITSQAIQKAMEEMDLSAESTCQGFDICPTDKISKLTFESMKEATLFADAIHSIASKGKRSILSFGQNDPVEVPSSSPKQRKCSDKTGLVITVPRTEEANSPLDSRYLDEKYLPPDGSNKRRKRDCEMSLASGSKVADDLTFGTDFYFILPTDMENLTDYMFLLYAQVKRGGINERDLAKANRSAKRKSIRGFRCRNCGGLDSGYYFPSCTNNLQACTPTLHKHLINCAQTPEDVKRALKLTKCTHRFQASSKPRAAQSTFFSQLWTRIHSESFNGADGSDLQIVVDKLDDIVEQSSNERREIAIPNIVSYDDTDHQFLSKKNVTDEDFDIALDLLRRPPTPDISIYDDAPEIDITPEPVNQVAVETPIATKISSSGERYRNGLFVVSGHDQRYDVQVSNKKSKKRSSAEEEEKTRKFSREAELLLVKGMLKHGKTNCWKKIYDEQPGLHHIKHSALKDRARSNRFKAILDRAELDPSLLERPDELCGSLDQPAYTEDRSTQSALNEEVGAEVHMLSGSHPASAFDSYSYQTRDEEQ